MQMKNVHIIDNMTDMLTKVVIRDKVDTLHDIGRGSLLGHVRPYGGVSTPQHQPVKSNTYQLLIEIHIQ
jgi:hypothetical protein